MHGCTYKIWTLSVGPILKFNLFTIAGQKLKVTILKNYFVPFNFSWINLFSSCQLFCFVSMENVAEVRYSN